MIDPKSVGPSSIFHLCTGRWRLLFRSVASSVPVLEGSRSLSGSYPTRWKPPPWFILKPFSYLRLWPRQPAAGSRWGGGGRGERRGGEGRRSFLPPLVPAAWEKAAY